jgi:Tfp pilus tip-associated adhesin PilY1
LSTVQNQRVIVVGTGRLLGSTDMSTSATQSVYAVVDSRQSPPTLISRAGLITKPLTQAAGGRA